MSEPEKDFRKLERLIFLKRALYAPIPVQAAGGAGLREALSKGFAMGAAMGAVGLGAEALSQMASSPVGSVPNTMAKGRSFQGMLESDASLQQMDPHKVRSMFNVVYQYFPAGAAEPMTAAGIVGSLAQYDRVDHKTIQDLIKMQKDYADTHVGQKKAPMGMSQHLMAAIPSLFM